MADFSKGGDSVAGCIFYVLSPCIVSALAHCMVVSGCCRGSLWSFVLVSTNL